MPSDLAQTILGYAAQSWEMWTLILGYWKILAGNTVYGGISEAAESGKGRLPNHTQDNLASCSNPSSQYFQHSIWIDSDKAFCPESVTPIQQILAMSIQGSVRGTFIWLRFERFGVQTGNDVRESGHEAMDMTSHCCGWLGDRRLKNSRRRTAGAKVV